MNSIVFAKGLLGDKSYAVQIRPVFAGGGTGEWGPTFSIVKRTISLGATVNPIISSPAGIRVSWAGTLDPAFDEQWLVKKFDVPILETNFDSSGTVVFRGSNSTSVDIDLNQEPVIYIGVAKVDKYGNRSSVSQQSLTFPQPSPPQQLELENFSGGFRVKFETQPVSNTNKYHIIKIIAGQPFTTHSVTNKFKSGTACSLTVTGTTPAAGDIAQISIGDNRFDGIYQISTVIGNSVSYTHAVSHSVSSTPAAGYIIPTSTGPSQEGTEVYRSEINASTPAISEFEYAPQQSGRKIYIAVGTEDAYKNRASWAITSAGNLFSYGRNFVAERDNITMVNTPNKTVDGYWKYGYVGWKNAHSTSTQELNTAATAGALKIDTITADTPDSIRLGVVNGTSTAMEFAKNPAGGSSNSQSRYYPDYLNDLTVVSNETLSKPLVDDSYYVTGSDASQNKRRANIWWDLHPSAPGNLVGLGKIWAECSASDILNDSNNTKDPIRLNGVTSLRGSFEAIIPNWGGANDNPTSTLALYAVMGDWSAARPGSVYDPHFYPVADILDGRAVTKTNSVTNKSKSSTTCTLTLTTASTYPEVGESITIAVGDTNFDGTFAVTTRASNVITYVTTSSSTVSSTATTGTVVVNPARSFTLNNKQKTGFNCTVKTVNAPEIAAGDIIDVRIADLAFDGENFVVTNVDIPTKAITYAHTVSSTVGSTAIAGNDKRVINRSAPPEVKIVLVDDWPLSKNPDHDLFTAGGASIVKQFDWSFTVPGDTTAESLRLVWVLEFDEAAYNESRLSGGVISSAWQPSTSYLVKLSKFEAWPSADAFATTGTSNDFSDTQYLKHGLDVIGDAFFNGSVNIEEGLYVERDAYVNGELIANGVSVEGDITVGGDIFSANGDLNLNSGTTYFWNDDYAIKNDDNPIGNAGNEKAINSMRAATNFPTDTPSYFMVTSWSGSFVRSDTSAGWMFRMYRWRESTGQWSKVREVIGGSAGGSEIGASMTHMGSYSTSDAPVLEFLITAQRTTGSGTINAGYGGTGVAENNRLQAFALPMSRIKQNTRKSTHLNSVSYPPSNTYTSNADSINTTDPSKQTKKATFVMSDGWTNSYTGTGAAVVPAGGDLVQGYRSNLKGNQRSAWAFNGTWVIEYGDTMNLSANPTDVKIISCGLLAISTAWFYTGGVAVIGTHNEDSSTIVGNWGNIKGKNQDRVRTSFRAPGARAIDLGLAIGKDLWSGHMISNIPTTGTGSVPNVTGSNPAKGILFGPGPDNSFVYSGSFARYGLKVIVQVEWKE